MARESRGDASPAEEYGGMWRRLSDELDFEEGEAREAHCPTILTKSDILVHQELRERTEKSVKELKSRKSTAKSMREARENRELAELRAAWERQEAEVEGLLRDRLELQARVGRLEE